MFRGVNCTLTGQNLCYCTRYQSESWAFGDETPFWAPRERSRLSQTPLHTPTRCTNTPSSHHMVASDSPRPRSPRSKSLQHRLSTVRTSPTTCIVSTLPFTALASSPSLSVSHFASIARSAGTLRAATCFWFHRPSDFRPTSLR
jgi:hypothetical protein